MVARKAPEGLPSGWTEQVKVANGRKVKCYTNVETGRKFYSKKDVIQYVKARNVRHGGNSRKSKHMRKRSEKKPMKIRHRPGHKNKETKSEDRLGQNALDKNGRPEWLPHGWIMELKTQMAGTSRGKQYKDNIKYSTGSKGSSEADVPLEDHTEMGKGCLSEQMKTPSSKPINNVVVKGLSPDTIPQGWIQETQTRRTSQGIKKDQYYTDPVSGYVFLSKKDVFRYLKTGDIKNCAIRPKKKDINVLKLMNDDATDNIKCSTGSKASSEADVPLYIHTEKGKDCISGQMKTPCSKPMNNVAVEGLSPDTVPPGWIKETKTRKTSRGIKMDLFYTDPVSGYVFRSKKDVFRYLETGDINNCAIRPKKKDINYLKLINDDASTAAVDGKKLKNHPTSRCLSAGVGKGIPATRSSATAKRMQENTVLTDDMITSRPTVEIRELSDLLGQCSKGMEDVTEVGERGSISTAPTVILAENGIQSNKRTPVHSGKSKSRRLPTLPGRSSKRLAGLEPEMLASSVSISGLSERTLQPAFRKFGAIEANPLTMASDVTAHKVNCQPEAGMPSLDKSAPSITRPLAKTATSIAQPSDGAILSSAQPLDEDNVSLFNTQVILSNAQPLDEAASSSRQPLDVAATLNTKPSDESAPSYSQPSGAAPSNTQPVDREPSLQNWSSNDNKRPVDDQPFKEQHMERQEAEKLEDVEPESQDPQLINPFGYSWSDPCLEFAFKTLTGAIPVDDNLDIQNYFQQLDRSHTQWDDGSGEFTVPNIFQNNVPSSSNSQDKYIPVQHFPENQTIVSPGHVTMHSCSNRGLQEPSWEKGLPNKSDLNWDN